MAHSRPETANRAARKKLGGSFVAVVVLENGRQIRAKLHQLSVSGGVLNLSKPLDEGIRVKLVFHIGSSSMRVAAKMLFPMWATQGCLQPFSFDELEQEERRKLENELQTLT